MRTSLEVVPRSAAALTAAVQLIRSRYPAIDTVNVPDLANCELRSVAAAQLIEGLIPHRIPHLRARDFNELSAIALADELVQRRIDEVIVIAGDPRVAVEPADAFEPTELISCLVRHLPKLVVYAAIDPHRYRDNTTLAINIEQKLAAGATGFFTQPLFELHDLTRVAPLLHGAPVFWGLSPVVSAASQGYWERVNRVVFPRDFVPTLKWSQSFALRLLSEVAARGDNAYLMPIKVDIETYLAPLEAGFASN